MTTRVLPDTAKLVRDYLAGVASVTSYVGSRVWTEAPANPQFPGILISRAGGIPEWYGDDRARLDVHCYGRTDTEAKAMARVVFKALMEAPMVHAEGVLTDIKPASDLQELRDASYVGPSAPIRYIFTVLVSTHS